MTDLTVRLVLTADGRPLRTEIAGASSQVEQLTQKAEQGGARIERSSGQAEQAVRRIGTTALTAGAQVETAMVGRATPALARLRQNFGQIGFQVGDFITQVQGGGNVFTAFAQQGGQLAGALAGGLAGLVVQIAAVGAQMLFAGSSTDQAARSALSYNDALRLSKTLSGEAATIARDLAEAKRQEAIATARNAVAVAQENLAKKQGEFDRRLATVRGPETAAFVTGTSELETDLRQRLGGEIAGLQRIVQEAQVLLAEIEQGGGTGGGGTGGSGGRGRGDSRTAAGRAVSEELARRQRLRQEGEQLARQIDPVRAYTAEVARLNEIYAVGGIDLETYNAGLERAAEAFDRAAGAASETTTGVAGLDRAFDRLSDEIAGAGRETAKMLADALTGVKALEGGVGGLIQSFASGILQKLIYDQITAPLAQAAGVLLRSGLSSLFGAAPASGSISTQPDLARSPLMPYGVEHGGAIIGRESNGTRWAPASLLDGAPRLHSGGYIGPGEVPAILKRGEGVFTAEQMAALGPGTTVQIIDQRGAGAPPVQVSEGRGPNGQQIIRAIIRGEVARGIAEGSFDGPMQMAYGVSRAGMR